MPLAMVFLLRLVGRIRSILLKDKEDRNLPYLITAAFYLFDFYLSKNSGAPALITAYLLAGSCVLVMILFINQFSKISIHAASMGSLGGIIYCAGPATTLDIRYLLLVYCIMCGLVLAGRLFLEAHTHLQLYSGFVLGLAIMIFIL